MAESICRTLRDGSLEGEHATALTIKDSLQSPVGTQAFQHILYSLAANIVAGKSQAQGLVLVVFDHSPFFYLSLLTKKGLDASLLEKNLKVLDCYSDPLGWKERILQSGSAKRETVKESDNIFRDVNDMNKLLSSILDFGKGFAGEGNSHFSIAIDSVSTVLRHASLPSVAGLISNLRSLDQVSSMLWLLHTDLHEPRTIAAIEYISSIVASLEPMVPITDGQNGSENLFWLEKNSQNGKFHVRLKRRNGRVKLLIEEFHMEQAGIKFTPLSSENVVVGQVLMPKLQFNLQLSENERDDRARVVLPFEHQGNGEPIQIYDGRRSLIGSERDHSVLQQEPLPAETEAQSKQVKGEIHYIRDSDDEQVDSDEDPDDDLDI
ncbi:Elongator complex protein 5 [Apostasia shenzhenica]|uniref:Elongator complex protein 5 n=1 Tax=Apostasia shenzhenica TaxID=1088818 RepID=A0A2H9ZYZ9_9ASPA|nr:Elongator complex protein 5 [Apostasia shenzhenica]